MKALHVLPAAQRDIDEIAAWIAVDSESAARRFLTSVRATFNDLADWPGLGAIVELRGRSTNIRRIGVSGFKKYLVYYRVGGSSLTVLRVASAARERDRVLRGLVDRDDE